MSPSQPILVLGMHRSGTSALTRVVNLLGADVPANLWPANEGNERGYWEARDLTAIQDELLTAAGSAWDAVARVPDAAFAGEVAAGCRDRAVGVLRRDFADSRAFVLKDPRMSVLVPFWSGALAAFGAADPVFLIAVRNPLEVAASLAKRNEFRPQKSMLLWLRHTLEAERATRGRRRCFVAYDALLTDWRAAVDRVARLTGLAWPRPVDEAAADIDAELSADLRHARKTTDELLADPAVPAWVKAVYPAAVAAAADPDGSVETDAFDRVRAAADLADDAYAPLMAEHHEATWAAWHSRIAAKAADDARAAAVAEAARARDEVTTANGVTAAIADELAARPTADDVARLEAAVRARDAERARVDADVAAQLAAGRAAVAEANDRAAAATADRDRLRAALAEARDESDALKRLPVPSTIEPPPPRPVSLPPLSPPPAVPLTAPPRPTFVGRLLRQPEPPAAPPPEPKEAAVIRASGLFDAEFYRGQVADLGGDDPVVHYLLIGAAAGLDPHPLFSGRHYAASDPDDADPGVNPLVHFLAEGQAAGRSPHPLFVPAYYRAQPGAGEPPLPHYLVAGWREELWPNWMFDTAFYVASNPDVAGGPGFNPLVHFVTVGWRQGRDPHPLFDVDFYLAANADVAGSGMNPLEHFLVRGMAERRTPNRLFDSDYYDRHNPDVTAAGQVPFHHYAESGWREGRNPGPAFDIATHKLFATGLPGADRDPLAYYLRTGGGGGLPPFGDDRLADRHGRPAVTAAEDKPTR